jgi:hypothetical protein
LQSVADASLHGEMSALSADDFAERVAALEERVSADPPTTWRPNDTDKAHPRLLVGELVRVDEGHTAYGPARIVVLRDGDGRDWSVWLLHAVLKQEFAKLRPRIGELVAVKYNGAVEPRDSRAGYESYTVVVDRADDAADWDSLEGDVEPAPTSAPAATAPAGGASCEQCGYTDPEHAAGCPNDSIPF